MVVLPEPEGPRSTMNSPDAAVRFKFSMTATVPNDFETLSSLMSAIGTV
jgi:hypothetical protein